MGQNHSLIHSCPNINVNNCTISFDASGNVSRYGVIELGKFQGNPGVAGEGVFWAFTIPLIIVVFLGLILVLLRGYFLIRYIWRRLKKTATGASEEFEQVEQWSVYAHILSDDLMLSSADAQLIFTLAYGTAFYSIWKCQVSLYHFLVAIHMVLIGLSTSAQSYSITRKFYKTPFMLLIRAALFWTGFIGLTLTTAGNSADKNFTVTKRIPSKTQLTSIGIVSSVTFVFAIGYNIFLFCHKCLGQGVQQIPNRPLATSGKVVFKFVGWSLCFFFTMWNLVSIISLRNWINSSAWLERDNNINPERRIQDLGQLVPLVTLINILFSPIGALSQKIADNFFPKTDAERKKLQALVMSSSNNSDHELLNL